MFQPRVKFEFVRRYCHPEDGWVVFVDIDASEEGRTGGKRTTPEARQRQRQMQEDAHSARKEFKRVGVAVGGSRADWYQKHHLPHISGDRDIVAFNAKRRLCLIAEVEGESSGQPEQKLYKALGQIVMAASDDAPKDWKRHFVLVVHGKEICQHAARAGALERLGVSAVQLTETGNDDRWLFGEPLPVIGQKT